MAFNPKRGWAITYNHMWNLCLKDPLPRNSQLRGGFSHGAMTLGGGGYVSGNTNVNNSSGHHPRKGSKPKYCWNFNKGETCKFGNKCHFIERCSYCDSAAHPKISCPKLSKKEEDGTKK